MKVTEPLAADVASRGAMTRLPEDSPARNHTHLQCRDRANKSAAASRPARFCRPSPRAFLSPTASRLCCPTRPRISDHPARRHLGIRRKTGARKDSGAEAAHKRRPKNHRVLVRRNARANRAKRENSQTGRSKAAPCLAIQEQTPLVVFNEARGGVSAAGAYQRWWGYREGGGSLPNLTGFRPNSVILSPRGPRFKVPDARRSRRCFSASARYVATRGAVQLLPKLSRC